VQMMVQFTAVVLVQPQIGIALAGY